MIKSIFDVGRRYMGKVARNTFSWHLSGKHLVSGVFKRHTGTLHLIKFSSRKVARYRENGRFVIIVYKIVLQQKELIFLTITKMTGII